MYVPTERAPDPGPPGGRRDDPGRDSAVPGETGRTSWPGETGRRPGEDVAFLASQRYREGSDPVLELRETADGGLAVLAYSSLDELLENCGRAQPWIAFRTDRLEEVRSVTGADRVLWNPPLTIEQRHPEDEGES